MLAPFSLDEQIRFRRILWVSDRPGMRIVSSTHYILLREDDSPPDLYSTVDDHAFRRLVTKETYQLLRHQRNFRDGQRFERELQAGLPLRSMVRIDPQPTQEGLLVGLLAPNPQPTTRAERVRSAAAHLAAFSPIWPAFLMNSLIYAFLSCLAFLAGVRWLRLSRQRRGLCPGCKYDLRGLAHPRCPECGFPPEAAPPTDVARSGKPG